MNAQGYTSTVLFTPPRLAEERKTYWPGMQTYTQAAVATGGFGRLGETDVDSFLKTVHGNFMDVVDTFTGAKGQREAQQNAILLAQLQSQQASMEAQQRAEGWGKAAPWLAVGGALVVMAVAFAVRR